MTRRIRRSADFEITVVIRNESFIRPPREAQRNWLLNRSIKEFGDDLLYLNEAASRFVPGSDRDGLPDRTQAELRDDDIMEDWQIPIMKEMAGIVSVTGGDVLEVGFGRGVASSFIQEAGVRSHTIVECNDSVVERYEQWKRPYRESEIRLLHGRWQDQEELLGQYDAILFHAYPLNEEEYVEYVLQSDTFADHFFATAAQHLRTGGVFTYMTNEIDSLSRGHQRQLLKHFASFEVALAENLALPEDTRDALWGPSMVIIRVVK